MKRNKFLLSFILFGLMFIPTKPIANAYAAIETVVAATNEANWTRARTNFSSTKDGLLFSQTEMGTPDNHAISILEVPFENTDSFEITFRLKMDEYIASGRNSNDVWSGIGIMGKPTFINWRNSTESEPSLFTGHGRAKDSPGLFTRFFNYSGDLRYEGSVYQENYHTLGEESTPAEIVDTWRLFEDNAGASINSDLTFKLSFDEGDFYNVYLNGKNITSNGEAAFIDRSVIFPDNKIYLLLVMNTEQDDFNELSTILVKNINGYSYLENTNPGSSEPGGSEPGTSEPGTSAPGSSEPGTSNPGSSNPGSSQPGSSQPGEETPKTGCFGETITGSVLISVALLAMSLVLVYRRRKVTN